MEIQKEVIKVIESRLPEYDLGEGMYWTKQGEQCEYEWMSDGLQTHKNKREPEDCQYWASNGECHANPEYMLDSCSGACYDLVNRDNLCTDYAAQGLCNQDFMQSNCALACSDHHEESCLTWAS